MFDTMKVAKRIKQARIAGNLTQMNLADAMGVSYQAVSNWERGNSLPDISKLEDLCDILQISVTELLGMEMEGTAAVTRMLEEEDAPLTVRELSELAPVLPPEQVKKQAKKQKLNIAALADIAPYLEEEFLEELLEDVEVESLLVLQCLAPYLEEDVLEKLVRKAPKVDFEGIAALAPFLEEETLDHLVKRCERIPEDKALLETLASYMSEETLDWLVRRWCTELNMEMLETLAPYLEEESMDALADAKIAGGDVKCLSVLYPYMDEDTVRKVAKALMADGDFEAMKEAMEYL